MAFPKEKAVVDVAGFFDTLCPSGAVSGGALLRRRQLAAAGWRVHAVDGRELCERAQRGSLGEVGDGVFQFLEDGRL